LRSRGEFIRLFCADKSAPTQIHSLVEVFNRAPGFSG
jgi:hypothetical protein